MQYSINGTWQSDLSFGGLAGGAYTVTVQDYIGFTANITVTVVQPAGIFLYFVIPNRSYISPIEIQITYELKDGEVTLTVKGGIGNYTYNWSNGETSSSIFLYFILS